MDRLTLDRRQVWIYLSTIIGGLLVGSTWPGVTHLFEKLLWPALVLLLYANFVQVPLLHLREAFRDRRFVAAMLVGNFIALPLLSWTLLQWLPVDPVVRLGVLLVLLVPCTDWFITFSQLGGGNVSRAIAMTPLNLLLELLLLPVYLWLMLGTKLAAPLSFTEIWPALLVVIVPMIAAAVSERWVEAQPKREKLRERLAWWPVPLLALVVFLIAKGLARLMGLPTDQGRTLAFSLGTRNSFVVLPFAFSLPDGWEMVAVVIVLQSLVELFGMVFYLWWIPRQLFR